MAEARLLLELAGEAALLLWGLHMVQTGLQRAFGTRLRQALGIALGNRFRAFLAGFGATLAMQSSTATALMVSSFAAGGSLALVPALATLLGANLATATIVQALSFDPALLFPPLVLAGVVAFRRAKRSRSKDLGRSAIGLGLMLLALHLMLASMAPVESSPGLRQALALFADQPLVNLLLAALLAWAMHSSVAAVLLIASLAGAGAIAPPAALAMVAGANLGAALNPLLESGGDTADPARLRLPLGNLLNRLAGCLLVLALLPWASAWIAELDTAPARLVANAHLGFNLAMALLAFPALPALARLLAWLRPERPAAEAPGTPRYLDPAALAIPSVALANAAREVLRIADTVEAMLRASAAAFASEDRDAGKAVARLDDVVDRLHRAVHDHLARLPQLPEPEARRLEEVRAFAIALEHAGDVLERDLARHAGKRLRRAIALDSEDHQRIADLHAALVEQLRLAVTVFMWQDLAAARRLVRDKEAMREAEQAAMRRLTETADRDASQGGAAAGLVLDTVRDLRRVGGHLATVAHPLLQRRGELLESRLAGEPPAEAA